MRSPWSARKSRSLAMCRRAHSRAEVRADPSRELATISACVELSPPETPMTARSIFAAFSRVANPWTWML